MIESLDTWTRLFREEGRPFQRAKVVLYRGAVATDCGNASSAVGPGEPADCDTFSPDSL